MNLRQLSSVFNNTKNSYKFYWWLSIIEFCVKENKSEIYFDEIVFKIISKLWFPVNYFKLSFGTFDQCSKYIRQIKEDYRLNDNLNEEELYSFFKRHEKTYLLNRISNELTRYVPYRFIRPWYNESVRGLKDSLVNSRILELQNSSAPYTIDSDLQKITINEDWLIWICTNYNLVSSFTYFELIKYLEVRNPNVSNLTRKLKRPKSRSLAKPTKFWNLFINKNPFYSDVFENRPLTSLDNFSIDHYLPWSFMTHDLLYNLHPVSKGVNSSKSNFIPDLKYLDSFAELQFLFYNFLITEKELKALEDYCSFFSCSLIELQSISKEQFIEKVKKLYIPQYEIAKNMGFKTIWYLN